MNNIFKAYDIRWIYPTEINEEKVYAIAFSFVKFLKTEWKTIVVWRDVRESSDSLIKNIIEWLTDAWADVIDIGLASTPMLYFANGKLGASGSIILTASHNPKQYNWMKLSRENVIPISWDTWIKEIEKLVLENSFSKSEKKWKVTNNEEIKKQYLDFIQSFALDKLKQKKLKIVIDSANAMWILEKEGLSWLAEIINIYDELDWTFPNHEWNPIDYSTLVDLQKKVLSEKADLWISFDWDADRVWFIDNKWEIIEPDYIWALISSQILEDNKWENILYDLRTSLIVPEIIEEKWWLSTQTRVGHSFIKEVMRSKNALFASELSGHYYFRDNYYTESSSLAAIYILNIISAKERDISSIVEAMIKYYKIPETNFDVWDKDLIINKIKEKYTWYTELLEIDWLKISYDDWWFSIRPSNTENVLRLNLEAKTEKLMKEKLKELSILIDN